MLRRFELRVMAVPAVVPVSVIGHDVSLPASRAVNDLRRELPTFDYILLPELGLLTQLASPPL